MVSVVQNYTHHHHHRHHQLQQIHQQLSPELQQQQEQTVAQQSQVHLPTSASTGGVMAAPTQQQLQHQQLPQPQPVFPAMLAIAAAPPGTVQNQNLNVIAAPIVVDFGNFTVNCLPPPPPPSVSNQQLQQHQQQRLHQQALASSPSSSHLEVNVVNPNVVVGSIQQHPHHQSQSHQPSNSSNHSNGQL